MADLKRLFELADEFGITTGQAMDLCDRLGISADSGTTLLTNTEADALRQAAHGAGLGARAIGPSSAASTGSAATKRSVAPPPGWVRPGETMDVTGHQASAVVPAPREPTSAGNEVPWWEQDPADAPLPPLPPPVPPPAPLPSVLAPPVAPRPDLSSGVLPPGARPNAQPSRSGQPLVFVVVGMGILAAIAFIGLVVLRDDDPQSVSTLERGDCFNGLGGLLSGQPPAEVPSFAVVPCSEPHEAEAVLTHDLSLDNRASSFSYPGDPALRLQLERHCDSSFRNESAGVASGYDAILIVPNETAWKSEHRQGTCAIGHADGSKTTGTIVTRD